MSVTEVVGGRKEIVSMVGKTSWGNLQMLQHILSAKYPTASALGFTVLGCAEAHLILAAPLAPNLNDKDTAFAGSLSALAMLAGWSTLWLLLRSHNIAAQIVLQDSSVQYLRPVASDFTAICHFPHPLDLERLVHCLHRKKKGRMKLTADIREGDDIAASFVGRYVASVPEGT